MTGRIITARHGRPDISREVKLDRAAYRDWWAQYDLAGLAPGQHPPDSLVSIAANAKTIFTSTLPRAIETAQAVTSGKREIPASETFVEAHLPPPPLPWIKASPDFWGVASRVFWILGYAPADYEGVVPAWARVVDIADQLVEASQEGDVLLCAHGYLNWMIDRELRKRRQWDLVARDRGNDFWSWRAYLPEGSMPVPSVSPTDLKEVI